MLSSVIRTRDSGTFTAGTNLMNVASATWDSWYVAPLAGDLRAEGNISQLIGGAASRPTVTNDFCGRPRPSGNYTLGALKHSLGDCGTGPSKPPDGGIPSDGGTVTGGDGGTGGGADGGADAGPGDGPSTGADKPVEEKGGCNASDGLAAIFLLSLLGPVLLRRRPYQHGLDG